VQFVGHKSWCSLVNVKDKWRVSLVGQQNQLLKKGKCLKGNSKPMGFFCKNTKSRPNMLMSQLCACRYDWIWQNRKINKLWTHFTPIFVVIFLRVVKLLLVKNIIKNALLQCKKRVDIHNFCSHKHPLVGTDQCCWHGNDVNVATLITHFYVTRQ
jgi:hypothetical protein